MATLARIFRSATRQTPRIQPNPPRKIADHMRSFSSTSVSRDGERAPGSEAQGFKDFARYFEDSAEPGDEATHTGPRIKLKRFDSETSFIQPVDLSRGGRIDTGYFKRSKRPLLGPGRLQSEKKDLFRQLDIDPVNEAGNSMLMSYYTTDMGKIRPRATTGLTWRSQRRLGKAIRRARMMGIIPQLSKGSIVRTMSNAYKAR
ncbi:hypothetical protein BDW22DRAFT_502757 [Trametopsis cervina]|nr:hypothetical protein BDW22DRAFT_502757 [Trametopsis cervina]